MGAAVSAIAAIGGGPRSTETRHFGRDDWTSAPSALGVRQAVAHEVEPGQGEGSQGADRQGARQSVLREVEVA